MLSIFNANSETLTTLRHAEWHMMALGKRILKPESLPPPPPPNLSGCLFLRTKDALAGVPKGHPKPKMSQSYGVGKEWELGNHIYVSTSN